MAVADAATMTMAEGVVDTTTMALTGAGRGRQHDTALGREHGQTRQRGISHNSLHLNSPGFVSASFFLDALRHIFRPSSPFPRVLPACLIVVFVCALPGPDFKASPGTWP